MNKKETGQMCIFLGYAAGVGDVYKRQVCDRITVLYGMVLWNCGSADLLSGLIPDYLQKIL